MKNRGSTLPTIQNTLKFCLLLLDEELLLESDNAITWTREVRQHRYNLTQLLKFTESESEENKMVMSQKSYDKCIATFGESFVKKLFKGVTVVPYDVPPVDAKKLFADIKAKGETAARTKEVKQPTGFFSESAGKAFEDALFHHKGANGNYGMPTMATTFSELRQARIEGELAEQFTMLTQNILQSSEFNASVKAEKLAALASEYSRLSRGEN